MTLFVLCVCTEPLKSMQGVLVIRELKAEIPQRVIIIIIIVVVVICFTCMSVVCTHMGVCLCAGVQRSKDNFGHPAVVLAA